MRLFPALLSAALLIAPFAAPTLAIAQDDLAKQIINTPNVALWNVYGPGQTHKLRKDPKVQGGGAMRVDIAKAQANVWDIGASVPINGAIKAGDNLLLIVWIRHEGEGTISIPAIIQKGTPPYSPILPGTLVATSEWQMATIKGVANGDYSAGESNVALQLGGTAGKIDLGPVFVLNQGQ